MTQIISYNIYRTEIVNILGKVYTVRFTSTLDGQDHALMVSNDVTGKQAKYHFSSEIADDFKKLEGKNLANEVLGMVKTDIENKII